MLMFAEGFTWDTFSKLKSLHCDYTSTEVIGIPDECMSMCLADDEVSPEATFAGLGHRLNTGTLSVGESEDIIHQLHTNHTIVWDTFKCKRQLIFVQGKFDFTKEQSKFCCAFLRWIENPTGTKKAVPTEFSQVIVLHPCVDRQPEPLADKSIKDVMICPYCNGKNCELYISSPAESDADMFEDRTGEYFAKCYCRSCEQSFLLNLKFRYEIIEAKSKKRF